MLVANNILQITDVQNQLGQVMLNVYHYRIQTIDGAPSYHDCAEAWNAAVRDPILDIQSSTLTHTITNIKNLTNGIDIWDELDPAVGTLGTTDNEPSFVALAFRLIRQNGTTRHGQKRIGGVREGTVIGNGVDGSITSLLTAAAAGMAATVHADDGSGNECLLEPVIVGRFPKGHAQEGELDLATINLVANAQFISVSTQNTRKAGRGI